MLRAAILLAVMQADGFRLRSSGTDRIVVEPGERLTDELRSAIRAERRGILMLLALQTVDVQITAIRQRAARKAA